MIPRIRSWSEFWYGMAGAWVALGILFAGVEFNEIRHFDTTPVDRAVMLTGKMQRAAKQVIIETDRGTVVSCPQSWCLYPGFLQDENQWVQIWMAGGRIIQVSNHGAVKDTRALMLDKKQNSFRGYCGWILLGCLFAFIGWLTKKPRKTAA